MTWSNVIYGDLVSPTQAERRESTIARLLDSGIDTIAALGYSRASVQRIAKRAGLSYGALFRHFPTVGDFMAEVARETLRRQLATVRAQFDRAGDRLAEFEGVMAVMRSLKEEPINAVLYELMVAARTDEQLRETLQVAVAEYGAQMVELARSVPGTDRLSESELITLVFMITDMFDGEALVKTLRPYPELVAGRDELLAKLLRGYRPDA